MKKSENPLHCRTENCRSDWLICPFNSPRCFAQRLSKSSICIGSFKGAPLRVLLPILSSVFVLCTRDVVVAFLSSFFLFLFCCCLLVSIVPRAGKSDSSKSFREAHSQSYRRVIKNSLLISSHFFLLHHSFSELCCLFCCPPCPSRIAAKLAFLPPEPTYSLVPNEELKSKFQLQLNEKAEWPYSERDKDTIESFYTRTSRGNRIACIFVKCCTNARYTLLFSHGNAVDLGQMSSFYLGLGSRINCNIFRWV